MRQALTFISIIIAVLVFMHLHSRIQYLRHRVQSADQSQQRCISQAALLETKLKTHNADVLWLARVIYSETKRPLEMPYVAWVVRNRVDHRFRGDSTYKDVALSPYQFSAFNNATSRLHLFQLDALTTDNPAWNAALSVAADVYTAPKDSSLLPSNTLYFYSEQSMKTDTKHPHWRGSFVFVPTPDISRRRFRFFEDKQCRQCNVTS